MPIPSKVTPVSRATMREEVYDALCGWIVTGVLEPGERILDTELATALGVSRTPVREALRRLEDEGFVEAVAGRWTRVAPLDISEAEHIYPLLWTLEGLAVRSIAPDIEPAVIARLRSANRRLRDAVAAADPAGASEHDEEFHSTLVRQCGNPHLLWILEELRLKLRRLKMHYFADRFVADASIPEHERVLDALERGDFEEAARAIEVNWRGSYKRVLEHMASSTQ